MENSRINSRRERRKPQNEWSDPAVPEYESDVDSRAAERQHNIAGATAASTGRAGLEESQSHKDRLR